MRLKVATPIRHLVRSPILSTTSIALKRQKRDASIGSEGRAEGGIHHLVLISCLLTTLMVGPIALVPFWVIKLSYRAARSPAAGEV